MRSFRIIEVGPKISDKCPYMRHPEERHREKREGSCADGDRDWSCAAMSRKPSNPWSHQKPDEARKGSLLGPVKGGGPAHT